MIGQLIATREAYGNALAKLGERYPDIVVLDADLSSSTQTARFAKKFPERFFNMGIAEQDMIGTSVGLALCGKTVFASTFAMFATARPYEQVRYSIGYTSANVKIVASHGGVTVGEDGASHQPIEDIGLMRGVPGMKVIVPMDAPETERATEALAETKGPAYMRCGRLKVPVITGEEDNFEIGKATKMLEGSDITVIACGLMVSEALVAARTMHSQGVRVRVLNMSTIKPLDTKAVMKAAYETGAIVTAEEHSVLNGLGSAVTEAVCENYPVPVQRIGVLDEFGQSGSPQQLLEKYGLTANHIVKAIDFTMKRRR